ncbi:U3 small nucleolar RNA-associated protein 4 homolog [Mya arenaria]|uniref:U3 small nucleolar RNA-associated protein 4 homolog n=1 Tax=Mya arenaria TaxID=6604 RepID=UPI0022E64326|nr:U3 small nucleolar RNA-associated protein 4 homolog [Mya arenaria]
MGEFRVHHIRFFEWTPQPVQCLAYNKSQQKLALSRSNGGIEIWDLTDDWYLEDVVPGKEGRSVEGLVWQGNRLFTAGLHGNVTEIDLVALQTKLSCSSNAGPIWCLTSNPSGSRLAAGTEEGCVVLFNTEDGALEYLSRFDSQESRILCLCWHPTEDLIVTGGIDNIRLWSVSSGRAVQRMTLARQDKNKETVVWCVAFLSDMTIVSGDSRGKTSFWNGRHGTVIKSISSHKSDVYCLGVDPSETMVVSSGVDSKVVQFSYVAERENSDWRDWVPTFLHNQHTHDVRAIQVIDNQVVTGGVDTNLILYSIKRHITQKPKMKERNQWRRIPSLPQKPLVHVAGKENVVMLQYPNYLEVWRLGYTDKSGVNGDILSLTSNPIKLIQLKTKGGSPVYCSALAPTAKVLAYSDGETVRTYTITMENLKSIQPEVSMCRIQGDTNRGADGAHCMCFLSDGERLVTVTTSSRLQLLGLESGKVTVEHTFPALSESYHLLCASSDDRYAAAADHACNVHIYSLTSKQHVCSVPHMTSQVTALAFHPDGTQLVMAYANQKIVEFDVDEEQYSDWTRANMQKFMRSWLTRRSKITNIAYNPSNTSQIVFNDEQLFCILDKTQKFPDSGISWQRLCSPNPDHPSAFHLCKNYKFLLQLTPLPDNWLVAVERPPLDMYSSLPEALKRKKFGT